VLLLDELPEFPRSVLEALRQPLEDGIVAVSRVGGHALFPARFKLVGTINLYFRRPVRAYSSPCRVAPATCTPISSGINPHAYNPLRW
jgi:magnesium chelatase family protein